MFPFVDFLDTSIKLEGGDKKILIIIIQQHFSVGNMIILLLLYIICFLTIKYSILVPIQIENYENYILY